MRRSVGPAIVAAAMGALATPVLADAPAYEELEGLHNAAAYFTVNLNEDITELIRLDVTNTDDPCDITTLSINNQPLPIGHHQLGKGSLVLPSGKTINALWTTTCVTRDGDGPLEFNPGNISPIHDDQFANMRPGMWLVVDILDVDGEEAYGGFEANFAQGGDYVRWHFADVYQAGGVDGTEVEMVTHFGGEVDWVVPWGKEAVEEAAQELEWLRTGLWGGIRSYRESDSFGWDGPDIATEDLQKLEHSAAFVSIDLGLYDEEERHDLRLDVVNSDQVCDPLNKIILSGKPLYPHMVDEFKASNDDPANPVVNGFFTLPSGPKIQASWTVSCVEEGQPRPNSPRDERNVPYWAMTLKSGVYMHLDIHTVDGVDVSYRDLGFNLNFAQGPDGVQWHSMGPGLSSARGLFYTKTGADEDIVVYWDPEFAQGLSQEEMRAWTEKIPARPSATEEEDVQDQPAEESQESKEDKCTDFQCLMDQIQESMTIDEFKKIDAQAEELVNEIIANHNKKQKPLTGSQPEDEDESTVFIISDSDQMKPITAMADDPYPVAPDTPTATPTGLFLTSLPPQDQDLLLTLCLAGTAFLLFTLISVFVFKSRPEPSIQRLPLRRETREERLARVANRRHALKAFFGRLFCGLFSADEKSDAGAPQGRDCRGGAAGDEGTMEQEISRFREAADMVESMIAAEEGRGQQLSETTSVESASLPPSYESDSAEGGVVVDGFRYMRVADGAWGEGDNEGSDRLGYGDK